MKLINYSIMIPCVKNTFLIVFYNNELSCRDLEKQLLIITTKINKFYCICKKKWLKLIGSFGLYL